MNEHSLIFVADMRIRDENKIQSIRKEALAMLVKEGFDGFSIQKLAKAAGVSPATIYIYFKDKEDLILQIWVDAANDMAKETLKNFKPGMSFSEGLKTQWKNRLNYCLKNPDQMKMWEQIRHSPLNDKALKLIDPTLREVMGDFVQRSIKKKELVKVPLEVYWSIAFAPLYTLANFHQAGQSVGGKKFTLTSRMINDTLKLVVKALTP
jgi:AcrR family transcriptional regulator